MDRQICCQCGALTHEEEGWPYYEDDRRHYCLDCALKIGAVDPHTWLKLHGLGIYHHAIYADGVITAFRRQGRGYAKDRAIVS